ncbi:hypothetical protein [Nostoc sp.]|uniref:hypothetical protein n=1 Tax=Nostoc sp. TaxID=1180 RepID=UPI002FFCB0FE
MLNQRGQKQLNIGQTAEALQTWQQATKLYQQLKDSEGVTGSLINQSIALQTLGLYPRACTTLLKALKLDGWICDTSLQSPVISTFEALKVIIHQVNPTSVNLLGLQNLAEVLRLLSKLNESKTVLQEILILAQQNSSDHLSNIYLAILMACRLSRAKTVLLWQEKNAYPEKPVYCVAQWRRYC